MAAEEPTSAEQPAPAEAEATSTTEAPALPGFYTDPNFVLGDSSATWRFGKPPDYSKTRRLFAESKYFMIICCPWSRICSTFLSPRGG